MPLDKLVFVCMFVEMILDHCQADQTIVEFIAVACQVVVTAMNDDPVLLGEEVVLSENSQVGYRSKSSSIS